MAPYSTIFLNVLYETIVLLLIEKNFCQFEAEGQDLAYLFEQNKF